MCLDDNGALHRLLSLLSLYYAFIIIITIIDNKVWFSFWWFWRIGVVKLKKEECFRRWMQFVLVCIFVIKDPKSFISTTNIVE